MRVFALLQRRSFGTEINDVCGETLSGEFKADPGAGRWFNKQIDDGFAAQCGHFFDGAFTNGFERAGRVEDGVNLLFGERFDIEKMFTSPTHKEGTG